MLNKKIDVKQFSELVKINEHDLSANLKNKIHASNLQYKEVSELEFNNIILQIVKKIDQAENLLVGEHRKDIWEKGWGENYKELVNSTFDEDKLLPHYYQNNNYLRFLGGFIDPKSNNFELELSNLIKEFLFEKYFSDKSSIYEFGCGTGINLILLSKIFPNKKFYGLDWTRSSQELLESINQNYNYHIEGINFNFFKPEIENNLEDGAAIFTCTALEQVGKNFDKFLDCILEQNISLCINIEPLHELYKEDNLLDYLALKYHSKREYLSNYLSALKEKEKSGVISILETTKINFGGVYNDSYSVVVWEKNK